MYLHNNIIIYYVYITADQSAYSVPDVVEYNNNNNSTVMT